VFEVSHQRKYHPQIELDRYDFLDALGCIERLQINLRLDIAFNIEAKAGP
jgi:hypothetical protein